MAQDDDAQISGQGSPNNATGDRWQSELLAAVREGSKQRDAAGKEAQHLRDQVAELEARIMRIEPAPTAALPCNSADSVACRATSPGSTLPAL